MICTDQLLSGVKKKACPQSILRGFSGKIVLRDWRGFNEFNPKAEYKKEVLIEAEKYSIKPKSSSFVRDDKTSIFTHEVTANVKNVSNEALTLLSGWQQIPVIVQVEKTDGEYIEFFKTMGSKLSIINEFSGSNSEFTQISFSEIMAHMKETEPPMSYTSGISFTSFAPADNGVNVSINTDLQVELSSAIVLSPTPKSVVLRESISLVVHQTWSIYEGGANANTVISGNTATFNILTPLTNGIGYEVIIEEGAFNNLFENKSPAIAAGGWNFTSVAIPETLFSFTQIGSSTVVMDPVATLTSGTMEWDFGDGTVIQSNAPTHTYASTGNRQIEVNRNGVNPDSIYRLELASGNGINISGAIDLSNVTGMSKDKNPSLIPWLKMNDNNNVTSVILPVMVSPFQVYLHYCASLASVDISGVSGDVSDFRVNNTAISALAIPALDSILFFNVSNTLLTSLDMSNIADVTSGGQIVANDCLLASIILPSTSNPLLRLSLEGNNLGAVDLSGIPNMTDRVNGAYSFQDNGMSQSEVDAILLQLSTNSTAGFTGRTINIGGTNAAPSATGLTYVADLQSKDFIVTHS